MHQVGDGGAQDAGGVYSKVRIEAAVLDGDERLRQIGRQILQRDIGAGHFAAGGDNTAVIIPVIWMVGGRLGISSD
jgi:hypothetical protein